MYVDRLSVFTIFCLYRTYEGLKHILMTMEIKGVDRLYRTYEGLKLDLSLIPLMLF